MKLSLFLCLFICSPLLLSGQDTIYLDSKFNPIEKGTHSYYRMVDSISVKKYRIRDYYNTDTLQMLAYSEKADDKHMIGTVIRYNKNGEISSICEHKTYTEGWITYYNKSGVKSASIYCRNKIKEGKALFYDSEGKLIARGRFKDDKKYSGRIPMMLGMSQNFHTFIEYDKGEETHLYKYYDDGVLAMKATLANGKYVLQDAVYYDETGKKLGSAIYSDGEPVEGVNVDYYDKTFWSFQPARIRYVETYADSVVTFRKSFDHDGNLIGECSYQYGAPFEGRLLADQSLVTYRNGVLNGRVDIYDAKITRIIHSYHQLSDKKEGPAFFYFHGSDSVATGTYKDDAPSEGYIYERGYLCHYVNGLRDGECINFDKDWNVLSRKQYKLDRQEGPHEYYGYPRLGVIRGIYVNHKPFDGDFLSQNGVMPIETYENGVKLKEAHYTRDSFILTSVELFQEQVITYYNEDGSVRFQGIKQNNKPYSGTFLQRNDIAHYKDGKLHGRNESFDYSGRPVKVETYHEGTLHGEYILYQHGKEMSRGEYKDGKPWNGSFWAERIGTRFYTNGLLEGTIRERIGEFDCKVNYSAGIREGETICSRVIKQSPRDTIKYEDFIEKIADTIYIRGFYEKDKPQNGVFAEGRKISTYVNGKKHGPELVYHKSDNNIIARLQYHSDSLHGEQLYYLQKQIFKASYNNGKITDGPYIDAFNVNDYRFKYVFYENGVEIQDTLEFDSYLKFIRTKNGEPYEGYMRVPDNYEFAKVFREGELVAIYKNLGPDTLERTFFQDSMSITYNKAGEKIATTIYSKSYSSGTTTFERSGVVTHTVEFRDDVVTRGCISSEKIETAHGASQYSKICIDSSKAILEIDVVPGRLKTEYEYEDLRIPWPYHLTFNKLFQYNSKPAQEERYIDKETNQLLAKFNYNNGEASGIKIRQDGNQYIIENYPDTYQELKVSFDEMLTILKNWKAGK